MSDSKDQKKPMISGDFSASTELHRVLFEEAADGMFITDPHWRYITVNPQYCEMTGFSREELIKMSHKDLVSPEDLARDPIPMEDFGQGKTVTKERRFIRKDGSLIPVEIRARMLSEGNILGIARDISERKQAEDALASEKQFSDAIIDGIPGIFYVLDDQGNILRWNKNLEIITGYTDEEFRRMNALETIEEEDRDIVATNIRRAFEKGYATATARLLTKDSRNILFLLNGLAVTIGGKRYLVGIGIDITDRKRAEEAITRERILSDDIINALPGIFYMYDAKGKLVRWNRKHEEATGYSSAELLGMDVLDFFAEEHKPYLLSRFQSVFTEGESFAEAPFLLKDGSQVPYYFTGRLAILDGSRYLLGVGIDITDRKRAEEEKDRLQAQLAQSQKLETIGRLAGGVAHDFNNMLGVILGQTELTMMRLSPSDPLQTRMEQIQQAAERSAALIQQLLAFARKQTISPRVLDLNTTVQGMLKMLTRLIGEDIDLIWQPGSNLSPIKMDPGQIDQILANLCLNSRDAISGGGKVTIETTNATFDDDYCSRHADFSPGDYVMLAVSDDGCGFDKETQTQLFEPFFTTKSVGRGTGLGLATVYGIVKQNEGFINVYSESGQGTTFRIYLRRYAGDDLETRTAGPSIMEQGRAETILLVEDEPSILKVGISMLKELGYQVLAVGRSDEAVQLARTHIGEIHVLMTDVVMPEMNGRELADRIAAIRPDIKCLFMSGYTSNAIVHRGVLDEGVSFIQKPFSMKDLAAKVREVLEQGKTC